MKPVRQVLLVLVAWIPTAVLGLEVLTLDQSVSRAFENNPRLLEKQRELSIAQVNTQEARSLYYPKVGLDLNYIRYRNETLGLTAPELGNVILEAPISNPDGTRANPLAENLYLGRVGFVQTLFAGGKVSTTNKLAQANVKRTEGEYESLKRQVEFETTEGFVTLLTLKNEKSALMEAMARLKKMSQGNLRAHDRLAVSHLTSQFQKQLTMVEKKERDSRFQFLQTIGEELFKEFDVDGNLTQPALETELNTLLAWAKQNRPELRQTQLQAEVDELAVNLSLAERYPVFLWGGGVEVRDKSFPVEETNWNTSVTMNIPIFDGFASFSRIKESRYRREKGRLKRIQFEDAVEKEVRSSYEDFNHWRDEYLALKTDLIELETNEGRYSPASNATVADKMDYLEWITEAKLSVINAQQEINLAKARLERAIGRPLQN